MIEGGCFCGAVRYQIQSGDYVVANCHCSMCRKTSAAPFVTWMVVPQGVFEYTKGQPRALRSSDQGTRYFCESCGSPLACVIRSHPDVIDVTTGSLDRPQDFSPTVAVHEESKLPWLGQTE